MRRITLILLSIAGLLCLVFSNIGEKSGAMASVAEARLVVEEQQSNEPERASEKTGTEKTGTGKASTSKVDNAAGEVDAVDRALERARREVRLLDDLYKTSVVLITTHYVKDQDSLAAASAARALFAAMKEKGWHEVRLIDATGQPYLDENLPQEGFETRAVRQLLSGKASYDEVVTEDGKRYLLAATSVPVVMEKCMMCHENYETVPENQAVGALSYKVPVQD